MNSEYSFNPEMNVFDFHFPGNPVVPGVAIIDLCLTKYASNNEPTVWVRVENVKFREFVLPNEKIEIEGSSSFRVIGKNKKVKCSLEICKHKEPVRRSVVIDTKLARYKKVKALRNENYWFLPGFILVFRNVAQCNLNIEELREKHLFLKDPHIGSLVALVEAAGNLALVIQNLNDAHSICGGYVFAQFDSIVIQGNPQDWAGNVSVVTEVNRMGKIMKWNSTVSKDDSILLSISGAISLNGNFK
ncbi:hypothetical protein [Chitinibacter sp. ZOR0017]|uniref:hypothetical protein n=1 Tax=Chitinibacter sp. ZOR0017 TaxID=1339254 RepID=UPI000646C4F1|nr:hypothetical protein [Chitinibacter sp. ZOR0017]